MKNIYIFYLFFILSSTNVHGQNTWQTKAPIPVGKISASEVFGIGNYGYVYGGLDSLSVAHNEFWKYDPLTDQWSQQASFTGHARYSAAHCVIGTNAYMGTGFDNFIYYNDWWEYDSNTNMWAQMADFPGPVRSTAISLTINDKGYLGMGKGLTWYDDWYEYNPLNNSWAVKANFAGGARQNGVGFGLGNYGYVGLGSVNNTYSVNDMYRYDPVNNIWSIRTAYPVLTGVYGVGYFIIGDKAFVCGGYDYTNLHSDCYEYNPTNDTWSAIADFNTVSPPRYFRGGFAFNGKGYLTSGGIDMSITGYRSDLIEYTSNYVGITEINDESNVELYYNNFNHQLIIFNQSVPQACDISIYNDAGQFIQKFEVNKYSDLNISISLSPGIYLYNISGSGKSGKQGKFLVY